MYEASLNSYTVTNTKSLADWVVSVQCRDLMPDPHGEAGSQDVVVLSASESLVPMHNITALRFLLRQPSPNWRTFGIDDIEVFRSPVTSRRAAAAAKRQTGGAGAKARRSQASVREEEDDPEILAKATQRALAAAHGGADGQREDACYDIVSLLL